MAAPHRHTTTAYENAVRKKRRRTEIQQVKRENNQYLLQVEKAKTHKRLQEKRKRTLAEAGEPVPEEKPDDETSQLEKMRNRFRQRGVSREENEDIDELLPSKKGQHGGPRKRQRVDRKRQAVEDVRADHLFCTPPAEVLAALLTCLSCAAGAHADRRRLVRRHSWPGTRSPFLS
jgi:hypothetical protein